MAPRADIPEVDLHGVHPEDVPRRIHAIVGQYARAGAVRVVHGRGQGVLKDAVYTYARTDPRITDCYTSSLNPGMTTLALDGSKPAPSAPHRRLGGKY